jgi:hypothetical protein
MFAEIRAVLESSVAVSAGGLPVVYDNTYETPPPVPYLRMSMSLDSSAGDGLGGDTATHALGVIQVNIYTPKMTGSRLGEEVAEAILAGWRTLAATPSAGPGWRVVPRSLEGPQSLAPDQREAHVVVVGAAFSATLYETP